jgi:ribonuclease HI
MLYDDQDQHVNDGREATSKNKVWKRIWGLCIPPKVRVFWWRVVNGFLPSRGELHRRHIEPTPNCETCGADEESIKHVLMDCTVAKSFWAEVKKLTGAKLPRLHPRSWAHDLVDPVLCSPKDAAIFLCGMWSLWMARNKQRHGEAAWPVRLAVQWVKDTSYDLWQLAHPPKIPKVVPTASQQWQNRLLGGSNAMSAYFFEGNRTGATGVVLRDHDGQSYGGSARWYELSLNALTSEALACRDGLQYARNRGTSKIILESDCQVLVSLWENHARQRSEIQPILLHMEELNRSFEDFSLCFVNRICNRLAHECAGLVSRENLVEEWLIIPPCLRATADADCNPSHG